MLELQRHFRAFLRQAASLEGVGKLVRLSDAHQELGLCEEFARLHTVFLDGGSECGEVHVGGDVLLAGGFIGICADGMLAKGFYCPEMTAGELLFAGVAIVDGEEESALDAGGDTLHELLGSESSFDALVRLG